MHFLCLHGLGTNSEILTAQTVSLRFGLEAKHTFDFVEGTVPSSPTQDTSTYYPEASGYFNYFDTSDVVSMQKALRDLHRHIQLEGPYDGVLAYSHGAALAATYIAQQRSDVPFQCAIFLSGTRPADPVALGQGQLRLLDAGYDGVQVRLPTTHIWGANDELYPGFSDHLSNLCDPAVREIFLHQEGHNIPNGKALSALQGARKAIRRTIDRTSCA